MLILALLLAVLVTSALSGALGMGGGILLMALLAALLPAPAALALHGAIQLGSNASRAALLWREIDRATLFRYALGSAASVLLFVKQSFVVDHTALFLALGAIAIGATLFARYARPETLKRLSLRSPLVAVACGTLVTSAHLTAGVAGPLLDVFFLDTPLGRQGVVATKAASQTLSHGLKLAYFLALAPAALGAAGVPWWGLGLLAAAGLAGSALGTLLLERISEVRFRKLTQTLVFGLGVLYLGRGLLALSSEISATRNDPLGRTPIESCSNRQGASVR